MGMLSKHGLGGAAASAAADNDDTMFLDLAETESPGADKPAAEAPGDVRTLKPETTKEGAASKTSPAKKGSAEDDGIDPDMKHYADLARELAASFDRFLSVKPAPVPGPAPQQGGGGTGFALPGKGLLDSWRKRVVYQHVQSFRDDALSLAHALEQTNPRRQAFEQNESRRLREAVQSFADGAAAVQGALQRSGAPLNREQQAALAEVGEKAGALADRLKEVMPDIAKAIGEAVERLMRWALSARNEGAQESAQARPGPSPG